MQQAAGSGPPRPRLARPRRHQTGIPGRIVPSLALAALLLLIVAAPAAQAAQVIYYGPELSLFDCEVLVIGGWPPMPNIDEDCLEDLPIGESTDDEPEGASEPPSNSTDSEP